jgi:TPR repeat protein
MYYDGDGVTRDYDEALRWFRAAAAQGSPRAQSAIAAMYEGGVGVRRDPVSAYAWFSLAADSGDASARQKLSTVENGLTSEELDEATELKSRLVASLRGLR